MWRWRAADVNGGRAGRNGLEEGEDGPRVLAKQEMAGQEDWVF
jgi:sarcosine oxidase/L-pipecolate oxidase